MIELRVTGEKPEEFFVNAMKTFALMATAGRGMQPQSNGASAETPPAEPEQPAAFFAEPEQSSAPPAEQVAEPAKPRRGRPPTRGKNAETADPGAAPVAPDLNDDIPDFLKREKFDPMPQAGSEESYTAADVRERTQRVIKAEEQRQTQAGQAAPKAMNAAVEHTKKLFDRFGIAKISELKPERYGDFMAQSEEFL